MFVLLLLLLHTATTGLKGQGPNYVPRHNDGVARSNENKWSKLRSQPLHHSGEAHKSHRRRGNAWQRLLEKVVWQLDLIEGSMDPCQLIDTFWHKHGQDAMARSQQVNPVNTCIVVFCNANTLTSVRNLNDASPAKQRIRRVINHQTWPSKAWFLYLIIITRLLRSGACCLPKTDNPNLFPPSSHLSRKRTLPTLVLFPGQHLVQVPLFFYRFLRHQGEVIDEYIHMVRS